MLVVVVVVKNKKKTYQGSRRHVSSPVLLLLLLLSCGDLRWPFLAVVGRRCVVVWVVVINDVVVGHWHVCVTVVVCRRGCLRQPKRIVRKWYVAKKKLTNGPDDATRIVWPSVRR